MVKQNITTYDEAINDFLNIIKKLPLATRNQNLAKLVNELSNSNLVVAQKILKYFNGCLNNEDDNQISFTNLIAEMNSIDITDYDRLSRESNKLKAATTEDAKKYVEMQEYNNYRILQRMSLKSDCEIDLSEQENELLTKDNVYFKEYLDVKKWLEYLDENTLVNQYTNYKMIAS